MKAITLMSLLIISLTQLSCAQLSRHPKSGYHQSLYGFQANDLERERLIYQRNQARKDLGLSIQEASQNDNIKKVRQRLLVKDLEAKLKTNFEREHYYRNRPFLVSDYQKIQFLSLPSIGARESFLDRLGKDQEGYSEEIADLITQQDIAIGMSRKAVRDSWGEPKERAVAGRQLLANERWTYEKYISSEEGYKKEIRRVYFEAGRVVSWETLPQEDRQPASL